MAKRQPPKAARKAVVKKAAPRSVPKKAAVRVAPVQNQPLSIMVSSTVHGSIAELDVIKAILQGFGYKVIMSKEGTIYIPAHVSNEAACLKAVEDCDLFLGIVFPRYGSGITHKEFKKAIELDKPRWFISHLNVTIARELLKQYMYTKDGKKNGKFRFAKTSVLDDIRVIEMYNDAIQNHLPFAQRKSNWAHTFYNTSDIQPFLVEQFGEMEKRREELKQLKAKRKK